MHKELSNTVRKQTTRLKKKKIAHKNTWAKELKGHLTKENIWMTNKPWKDAQYYCLYGKAT